MKSTSLPLLLGAALALGLGGCATWYNSSRHEANSVVQFLYPDKTQPFIQPQIPTLRLPLRVGLAVAGPDLRGAEIPPAAPRGRRVQGAALCAVDRDRADDLPAAGRRV